MTPATTRRPRPRASRRLRAIVTATAATAALATPALAQTAPPGRAYEQVSPVDKNGADVSSSVTATAASAQASADGSSIVYGSTGTFPGAPAGLQNSYYLARRDGAPSWTTGSLSAPMLPAANVLDYGLLGVSADGSKALVGTDAVLAPVAVSGHGNLYLLDTVTGGYTFVATGSDLVSYALPLVYGTDDFSVVAFAMAAGLTPDAPVGGGRLIGYIWSEAAGIDVLSRVSDGAAALGHPGSGDSYVRQRNVVSEDGSRVFYGAVYQVEDVALRSAVYAMDDGVPRLLSRSVDPDDDPSVPGEALFIAASRDGSKVAYLAHDRRVYLHDLDSDEATAIVPAPVTLPGAVATSDDLSSIYFVSEAVLADGGVDGYKNLYHWRQGAVTLVAAAITYIGQVDPRTLGSYTPPSGASLIFQTRTQLTGYDNSSAACQDGRCRQVYVYDALEDEVSCVSCRPDGGSASGDASTGSFVDRPYLDYEPRSVLDDGRVFFDSPEALVAGDTNGRIDAYQWHDGVVSLISSGRGESDSHFSDASADGRDLFFVTGDRLVGQDIDNLADLYDARLGGGIASQSPPRPEPPCTGDGCQGGVTGGRGGSDLGSLAHSGPSDRDRASGPAVLRVAVGSRLRVSKAGVVGVKVRVRGAGRVVARASARVGGRRVAVGSARANARQGSVRLALRLNRAGRQALARRGRLAVRIVVSGTGGKPRRASVLLIGGRR